MFEIGQTLKEARVSSGVSLAEASKDLNIKEVILENIEEGSMGCFKDIYELKDYIASYAKYLGLNVTALIDDFNEYLFEYTSKIPLRLRKKLKSKIKKKQLKKLFLHIQDLCASIRQNIMFLSIVFLSCLQL